MIAAFVSQEFPLLSVAIVAGVIVGGVVAWFAAREARKKTGEAYKDTIAAYKENIEALSRQIAAITAERDMYRNNLHNERDAHNAVRLRCKELELRPDLADLFKAQTDAFSQQNSLLRQIGEGVKESADGIKELLRMNGHGGS